MIALLALIAPAQAEPAASTPPAILAYYRCVENGAAEAEARTHTSSTRPAPDALFAAAETQCQPLYAPALDAFYATTMKTDAVQAYIRGKDEKTVRAEVEAGLRSSLKDRILHTVSLLRGGADGDAHAQN